MPILRAHKLCPEAIYRYSGYVEYKKASKEVMAILSQFDTKIRQVSIDEAYLDVSEKVKFTDVSTIISLCKEIQDTVWNEASLPISIGASHTRTIAKIVGQLQKPKGITVVPKDKFRTILDPLPLRKISGIGKKTSEQLKQKGYETIGDVAQYSIKTVPGFLKEIWLRVHGFSTGRTPKTRSRSHSRERTFGTDEKDHLKLRKVLRNLTKSLLSGLGEEGFRTFSIKVRFSDFKTATRSRTFISYIQPKEENSIRICLLTANELFNEFLGSKNNSPSFRLLGVKASNFSNHELAQRTLFDFLQ
jgi:nucleotidyltransferase/DNA polymerase involved in DNA repair